MLDREQVLHVARLARLELSEEEVERMASELSHVLDHIEKISELDLDGVSRFLARAWRLIVDEDAETMRLHPTVSDGPPTEEQARVLHRTIKAVSDDMEALQFNTAIARLMEFVNFFTSQSSRPRPYMEVFVLMLAPLAPHIAEEMWQALGHTESLAHAPWPVSDARFTLEEAIEIPIQVNGKVRSRLVASITAGSDDLERMALEDPKIQRYLDGHAVQKVIVVPKKLINIVVSP